MAVPVRADLVVRVLDLERRHVGAMARLLDGRRLELRGLARGLPDPRSLLELALQQLDSAAEALRRALARWVERQHERLKTAAAGLRPGLMGAEISRNRETLADLDSRLARALRRAVDDAVQRFGAQARLLESYGYEQVLERGFVLARDDDGRPVTQAADAKPGTGLALTFKDGGRHVTVDPERGRRRLKPSKPLTADSQGRLI
jgi:exodeoxyribonuclease VII large subunit